MHFAHIFIATVVHAIALSTARYALKFKISVVARLLGSVVPVAVGKVATLGDTRELCVAGV